VESCDRGVLAISVRRDNSFIKSGSSDFDRTDLSKGRSISRPFNDLSGDSKTYGEFESIFPGGFFKSTMQ
jgi:hypothetical protein